MRIVYLNTAGQLGGAESSLVQLLAAMRSAQPEWDLSLILAEDGPLAGRAEALGVATQVVPMPAALSRLGDGGACPPRLRLGILWQASLYTRQLAIAIRRLKPDVIHSTGFKMHVLSLWARPLGVPVIWHIHDHAGARPVMRRLLRWHSNHCALVLVNSKGVGDDFQRACSTRPEVVLLYNAVDLEEFSPRGEIADLDAVAGLPPASQRTLRVGLLATFAKWKGHALFLQALSLLTSQHRVRGYVIGGPIYQTQGSQHSLSDLREAARGLGLTGDVGFTGFLARPASAMRALDVIVHASTQPEPFGMVIAEGMACGKPVIASASSGAAEIFRDGENVLAYQCGDAVDLAQRIMTFLEQPELRARIGQSARSAAEQLFQGSRLAAELVAIYQRCASSM